MTQYNTLNVKLPNFQLNKLKFAIKNRNEITLNLSSNLIQNSNDETNFPQKLLLADTQVTKIRKAFANGSSANIKFSKTQLSKIVQLGGVLRDIPIFGNILSSVAIKGTDIARNLEEKKFLHKQIDRLNKEYITGSGITLTNNEIKDIMKVIKSLENRGILLKGTTRKITSQEGGFLNFLRPLMTAGLPLMKSVLTPLAKSVLLPLELSAGMSTADAAIQKTIYGSGATALITSNEEMEDIKENS